MSLQINMNSGASAQGGLGVGLMTSAGNPWTVADALAQDLVNRGLATAIGWPANTSQPFNNAEVAGLRGAVSTPGIRSTPAAPLIMIASGNSIVDSYGSYLEANGVFFPTAILLWGMWFGGVSTRTNRLSSGPASDSLYWDRFGNLGHGGATLDVVTQDLFTSGVLVQFGTDGVQPDIVAGVALPENDIATGVPLATITARVDQWVASVRALWPGARIMLGTPLPAFSYDTPAKQAVAFGVAAYMRSLESMSNNDIYCVEQGASYANAAYQPLSLAYVEESAAPGTGTVHPQPKAAVAAGRAWGAKLRAIFGQPSLRLTTSNQGLVGSTSAGINGTGVTGTMPTNGGGYGFAVPAWATMASTALNPGWRTTITKTALTGTDNNQLPALSLTAIPAVNGGFCDPYIRVKFVSGAALINMLLPRVRAYYTDASNGFIETVGQRTSDVVTDHGALFLDGDELLVRVPRCVAAGGKTIQTVQLYLNPYMRDQLGTAVIDVTAMGLLA